MTRERVDTVMLVDDNEIDIFINKKVLELCQFSSNILAYRSAREALDFLKKAPLKDIPDLIFLDLNMPVINGFAFLSELVTIDTCCLDKISVIILTSSENEDDLSRVSNHQAVRKFITKPLSADKLTELRLLITCNQEEERL